VDNNLPPQRLVLAIKPNRQITTRDFRLFMEELGKQHVADGTDIAVSIEQDGTLKFAVPVPPRVMPKKSAHQKRVEAQIASRREQIANGEDVPGYVPPVKQKRVVKLPKQRTTSTKKKIVVRKARTGGSKDE
jgi:hypothetical protein